MANDKGKILAYPRWKLKEIKDDRYPKITERDLGIMKYKKTNFKIIFKVNQKKLIDKSIICEKLLNDNRI